MEYGLAAKEGDNLDPTHLEPRPDIAAFKPPLLAIILALTLDSLLLTLPRTL